MSKRVFQTETRDHVTIVRIDSPPDEMLAQELRALSEQINYDTSIHTVIVTGANRGHFLTGDDRRIARRKAAFSLSDPIAAIHCPVIAAMNADAVGPALEIALACDIRIASEEASFAFPYLKQGVLPLDGASQRLPRLVGQAEAMELLLTGREVSAVKAQEIGLVNSVVPKTEVLKAALQMAGELSDKAPLAVSYCKEAVLKGLDLTLEQGLRLEGDLYFLLHTTKDRSEGINAFRGKRRPQFRGK